MCGGGCVYVWVRVGGWVCVGEWVCVGVCVHLQRGPSSSFPDQHS